MADMTAATLDKHLKEVWSDVMYVEYRTNTVIVPLLDHTWEKELGIGSGDTVNIASRLEGACKQYSVPLLIGEKTHEMVQDHMIVREIDIIRVLGKKKPLRVYEVVGDKEEVSSSELERISHFHRALKAYRNQEWGKALTLFREEESDRVAKIYVERCQRFRQSPPPKDWDGVYDLKTK